MCWNFGEKRRSDNFNFLFLFRFFCLIFHKLRKHIVLDASRWTNFIRFFTIVRGKALKIQCRHD